MSDLEGAIKRLDWYLHPKPDADAGNSRYTMDDLEADLEIVLAAARQSVPVTAEEVAAELYALLEVTPAEGFIGVIVDALMGPFVITRKPTETEEEG